MEILNWRLLSHPMNWVVLFLMVFIAGIAVHFVFSGLGIEPPDQNNSTL